MALTPEELQQAFERYQTDQLSDAEIERLELELAKHPNLVERLELDLMLKHQLEETMFVSDVESERVRSTRWFAYAASMTCAAILGWTLSASRVQKDTIHGRSDLLIFVQPLRSSSSRPPWQVANEDIANLIIRVPEIKNGEPTVATVTVSWEGGQLQREDLLVDDNRHVVVPFELSWLPTTASSVVSVEVSSRGTPIYAETVRLERIEESKSHEMR